ncbi:MAG: DUF4928 family protein [Lewinellaceae bacterium]|nr:DUF4928 family protein [Lewinellaceae bacterium]
MSSSKPLQVFHNWYHSLEYYKQNNGPAMGTIAASLVVLDRLKKNYDLNLESHLAPKGTQIKGASGRAVSKILAEFGETRPFAKEGGRTNRGLLSEIQKLLEALKELNLGPIEKEKRDSIITEFQHYIVDRVKDFHNRQKVKLVFDPKFSTWQNIRNLLEAAAKENKAGPVSQHLVGAKLQLRFPDIEVSNESAFTADQQTKRQGDFAIGDSVFHVTISPMQGVFIKCQENIKEGFKPFLLVPDSKLAGARQLADEISKNQIAVESIESFVSQNIEEISHFKSSRLSKNLTILIEIYNERVDACEIDKSLMIELPSILINRENG